jgi:hypothetical protein
MRDSKTPRSRRRAMLGRAQAHRLSARRVARSVPLLRRSSVRTFCSTVSAASSGVNPAGATVRLASTSLLAKVSSQRNPLCICRRPTHESPFVPAYPLGSARAAWECQCYHFWKQLSFEILTDVVSCQGICTRGRFSSSLLTWSTNAEPGFQHGTRISRCKGGFFVRPFPQRSADNQPICWYGCWY